MAMMLVCIALVALSSHLAPMVARSDIFFGVTVAPGFRDSDVARRATRWYRLEIWGLAAVAAALVATSPWPVNSAPMLLVQAIGASVAFAKARHALLPYAVAPAMAREAEIGPRPSLPGGLAAQMGPFVILLAAAVYVGLHYHEVPARFPTHWNLAGLPDGYTVKSVGGVFRVLIVGVIACGLTLAVSYNVLHNARLPRVSGADGRQNRRVRHANLLAMLATEYLVALLVAWASMSAMFTAATTRPRLPLVLRIAPFALLVIGKTAIVSLRHYTYGTNPPVGDSTPDRHWILGLFYVNVADPVLFVEKRLGLGYTFNYGNPRAWAFLAFAAALLSIPIFFVP